MDRKQCNKNYTGELDEARVCVYQEAYLAWIVARRTGHEQLSTVASTGSGQTPSDDHQGRRKQKQKPTSSQPGYEWSNVRDDWYAGG